MIITTILGLSIKSGVYFEKLHSLIIFSQNICHYLIQLQPLRLILLTIILEHSFRDKAPLRKPFAEEARCSLLMWVSIMVSVMVSLLCVVSLLFSPKSFDLIKISRWHPWAVNEIDTFLHRTPKEEANEET